MDEKIGEVTASLIKNGNGIIAVILHSPFFSQMKVSNAQLFFGSYDPELNVILEPRTPEEDSFADQVVKEVEEFEQLALDI